MRRTFLATTALTPPTPPAGDTTPPTITSSGTHSVAENHSYAATATASETVTWAKGGTDAALVTLNTSTGGWSVSSQDYEVKTSVVFTLTATDAAGNASTPQTVTLTVTDEDEIPNAFSFTSATGVAVSSSNVSNTITISGLGAGVSVPWTSSLPVSKNGLTPATSGTAQQGDTFAFTVTASASPSTAANALLTVGGVSSTYTVTTAASGALATVFATAPAVHYHFDSQTVSVDGSSRLTSCPDLQGLANLLAVSGTTAPTLMTDALGRDFLRFNGSEGAAIANALAIVSNRSFMALMVGRSHHAQGICHFLNPRFASYTSPTVNTQANSSIGYLKGVVTSASAPFLQAGSPAASTNAADCYKVIPGAQMQVLAVASRVTASGGTRLYCNNDTCDVAQQSTAVSNYIGGLLGGTAGASNTETMSATTGSVFDLYELAIWTTGPNNTDANAAVAAAVSNYAIAQLDSQLVLEGDSITYGATTTLSESPFRSRGLGSRLTEPGAGLIPANVRVLNLATTGNTTANLVTKRDDAASVFALGKYPGGASKNVVAIQIGRNDMVVTAGTAASHYANVVALINTATTGYLQRGWKAVAVGNIAGTAASITGSPSDGPITLQQRIEAFRAMLFTGTGINATFANDTLSGSGQTYAGLVAVLPLHMVTVAGDTKFSTSTDAGDTASGYYDSDSTHLRVAGADLMANGGETPGYGYGAIL